MTIQEELRQELKAAMREKDQKRLNVIRQVEAEMSLARTAPGFKGEIDDNLYRQVIGAYVKKMDKARKEYEQAGERAKEMIEQLSYEIEYLSRWLPRKLGEEETRELVRKAKAETGITDVKMVGKLVGQLMKAHGEALNGGLVNKIAREELGAK